ncbi:hypothetical protein BK140_11300 [Paenibacillus macerans]|nr:hypothetical protein BK140_11300 [Paenibacillus macerans]
MLDKGLKREFWSPEQIAEHCKKIGADWPPPKKVIESQLNTTAPQLSSKSRKYRKRGGEY